MVENLSVSLFDKGIDSKIVSLYNFQSAITERLVNHNIPIHYLNKKKGIDFKIIFKLYKYLRIEKPDVIHTHLYTLPYVSISAVLAKVPVKIHSIHSIANQEVSSFKRKIHNI